MDALVRGVNVIEFRRSSPRGFQLQGQICRIARFVLCVWLARPAALSSFW